MLTQAHPSHPRRPPGRPPRTRGALATYPASPRLPAPAPPLPLPLPSAPFLQPSAAVRIALGESDDHPFEGMDGTPVNAAVTGAAAALGRLGWQRPRAAGGGRDACPAAGGRALRRGSFFCSVVRDSQSKH